MGSHIVNLMVQGANRALKSKSKKIKKKRHAKASQTKKMEHKSDRCYFHNKKGHYQKDCLKCKDGLKRKVHLKVICALLNQT